MKLSDFKGLKDTHTLIFDEIKRLDEDYFEVYFKPVRPISFRAGEHGILSIPTLKKSRKWRAFSLASSPKEKRVIIGTKTGAQVSPYKDALMHMKPGEMVKLRGPFGGFVEQKNAHPHIFIALGVGITPIRSILMDQEVLTQSTLLYVSKNTYMFDETFTDLETHGLTYIKFNDRLELHRRLDDLIADNPFSNIYISGRATAVKSISKRLVQVGVPKSSIVTDLFIGY